MKRLLYIILYMALAVHASAQVKVTGRVIDLQNKPVGDVIVKLVNGGKTLAFTSTNAKGEYALEVKNAPSGEVSLQFNHISYEKESERLTLKERTLKVDMVLTPKAVSLKEVTVKPDPLRQKGGSSASTSFRAGRAPRWRCSTSVTASHASISFGGSIISPTDPWTTTLMNKRTHRRPRQVKTAQKQPKNGLASQMRTKCELGSQAFAGGKE